MGVFQSGVVTVLGRIGPGRSHFFYRNLYLDQIVTANDGLKKENAPKCKSEGIPKCVWVGEGSLFLHWGTPPHFGIPFWSTPTLGYPTLGYPTLGYPSSAQTPPPFEFVGRNPHSGGGGEFAVDVLERFTVLVNLVPPQTRFQNIGRVNGF